MFMTEGRVPESQPFEQHPATTSGGGRARPRREARAAGERPARILVVDDNVDLARGLARLLADPRSRRADRLRRAHRPRQGQEIEARSRSSRHRTAGHGRLSSGCPSPAGRDRERRHA